MNVNGTSSSLYPFVSVDWFPEKQDWLLPAVVAFQAAAEKCQAPTSQFPECRIAFNISPPIQGTESKVKPLPIESGRAQTSFLHRSSPMDNPNVKLVAIRPFVTISSRQVLSTRMGLFLWRRHLLASTAFVSMLLNAFCYVVNPGGRTVVAIGPESDAAPLECQISTNFIYVFQIMCIWFFIFAVLHAVNRGLFRCSITEFEVWVLIVNYAIRKVVTLHSKFYVLEVAGELTGVVIAFEVVREIISNGVWFFIICNTDAIIVNRASKIVFVALFGVYQLFNYITNRLYGVNKWRSQELCWWSHCALPIDIYLTTSFNIIIFICKMMVAYLSGSELAFVRSLYKECLNSEQAVARLSDAMGHSESLDFQVAVRARRQRECAQDLGQRGDGGIEHIPSNRHPDEQLSSAELMGEQTNAPSATVERNQASEVRRLELSRFSL